MRPMTRKESEAGCLREDSQQREMRLLWRRMGRYGVCLSSVYTLRSKRRSLTGEDDLSSHLTWNRLPSSMGSAYVASPAPVRQHSVPRPALFNRETGLDRGSYGSLDSGRHQIDACVYRSTYAPPIIRTNCNLS